MLATARMCVMEKGYFGFANMAAEYLLRLAGLGALLMIWRSLFLQGADTGGMTLNQLYVYTILSAVLAPMLDVRTPASGWLHEGAMLSLYVRPAGIFAQLAAHTMGGWALPFLLLSLPVTAAALIAGNENIPLLEVFKTDRIEIAGEDNVPWTLDGEFGGNHQNVVIENLQYGLQLYC